MEHEHRFRQMGQPWPQDLVCQCGYTLAEQRGKVKRLPDGRYRVLGRLERRAELSRPRR